MGVNKILTASNDTLFNFEDTLDERDDLLSPRTPIPGDYVHSNGSNTPQTLSPFKLTTFGDKIQSDDSSSFDSSGAAIYETFASIQKPKKPTYLALNLKSNETQQSDSEQTTPTNVQPNDLLSPEQSKTLSDELNTIELQSSELSRSTDMTTNTLDDLKTCISVHGKGETISDNRNASESLSEWSESSTSLKQINDLNGDQCIDLGQQTMTFLANERNNGQPVSSQSDEIHELNSKDNDDQQTGDNDINDDNTVIVNDIANEMNTENNDINDVSVNEGFLLAIGIKKFILSSSSSSLEISNKRK